MCRQERLRTLPDHDIIRAELDVRAGLQLLLQVVDAVEAEDGAVLHYLPLLQVPVDPRLPRPQSPAAAVCVALRET